MGYLENALLWPQALLYYFPVLVLCWSLGFLLGNTYLCLWDNICESFTSGELQQGSPWSQFLSCVAFLHSGFELCWPESCCYSQERASKEWRWRSKTISVLHFTSMLLSSTGTSWLWGLPVTESHDTESMAGILNVDSQNQISKWKPWFGKVLNVICLVRVGGKYLYL